MTTDFAAAIAKMQANRGKALASEPYRTAEGKWRHPMSNADWSDEASCRTDYRFCQEWGCK